MGLVQYSGSGLWPWGWFYLIEDMKDDCMRKWSGGSWSIFPALWLSTPISTPSLEDQTASWPIKTTFDTIISPRVGFFNHLFSSEDLRQEITPKTLIKLRSSGLAYLPAGTCQTLHKYDPYLKASGFYFSHGANCSLVKGRTGRQQRENGIHWGISSRQLTASLFPLWGIIYLPPSPSCCFPFQQEP